MQARPAMRTLKIIVGGEGNVGKTSLVRAYARNKFDEARNVTLGIDITTQIIDLGEEAGRVRLQLFDIEGQQGDRPGFFEGAHAAMLVYAVDDPQSYQQLARWHERLVRYAGYPPESLCPVLVRGNKCDLTAAVDARRAARTSRALFGARDWAPMSARTGENVGETFRDLAVLAFDFAVGAAR